MPLLRSLIAVLAVWGACCCATTGAEEFILQGGGRIVGEVLNAKQIPRTDYLVKTAEGVIFKIDRAQVTKKLNQRPELAEYEQRWPLIADTAAAQWELAEWCRERTLLDQRERHLNRILEIEPDHELARRALGFELRNGRWSTRDDRMKQQGYIWYEGDWRMAEEIQLIEEERVANDARSHWLQKLKRLRGQLESSHADEARRAIQAMDDPQAISAVALALADERNPDVRELYLLALGKMPNSSAATVLATWYMKEPLDELRLTCLDQLKDNRDAVDYFAGKLGNSDNSVVNRAGAALGYLGDPVAIEPLIRGLVTNHKFRIKSGNNGQTSAGFGSGGGGGFSAGGSDKIITKPIPNRAVLDSLVALTGKNFGYDIGAWKVWHAGQRRYEHVNARRD